MPKQQRKRTPKTSQRIHGGGGKYRPTELEKALMGQGCLKTITQKRTHRARKILASKDVDQSVIAADYS